MALTSTIKDIALLAGKIDNIELTNKVVELQTQLLELIETNASLKERIRNLEASDTSDQSFVFKNNLYWKKVDGKGSDVQINPFCPKCKDGENKQVRLHREENYDKTLKWQCPCCLWDHGGKLAPIQAPFVIE